ncbi:hypothetical protein U1Q18_011170 [Sarracenia purpurea var. burkii]
MGKKEKRGGRMGGGEQRQRSTSIRWKARKSSRLKPKLKKFALSVAAGSVLHHSHFCLLFYSPLPTARGTSGCATGVGDGGARDGDRRFFLLFPCLAKPQTGFSRCAMRAPVASSLTGDGRQHRRWCTGVTPSSSLPRRSLLYFSLSLVPSLCWPKQLWLFYTLVRELHKFS